MGSDDSIKIHVHLEKYSAITQVYYAAITHPILTGVMIANHAALT